MSWDVRLDFGKSFAYSNPQIRVPRGSKNADTMKVEVSGLSDNKIEKLLVKNEAE